MPKRTHVDKVSHIENTEDLNNSVIDKRKEKRAKAKKNRRNRHYVKVILKSIQKDQNLD